MMSSESVIEIRKLSKQYRLGEVGTGTLSHDLNRLWCKIRGKEDPYSKVGEVNDRTKKGNSDYVQVLNDINFDVKKGEILGIIGKNGAGKSTLLKVLSKVTGPTDGTIKTNGRIASLLEVGTGFHPELTGRDNIYMNGTLMGMTKAEIAQRFDSIVRFAGVERYIDTPVKRYSSGMTVRLGFAIAAYLEPEILIVDEVLAVGDAEFQKKALGKMKDVSNTEERTILFVSHNMSAIENLCSRCIVLENGEVAFDGETSKAINYYLHSGCDGNLTEWNNYKNEYNSPIFQIQSARVVDNYGNAVSGSIKNDVGFSIIIEGNVQKIDPALQVGISMSDGDGNLLFWSCHNDVAEEQWKTIREGINIFKCSIPPHILNEGVYYIEIIVAEYHRRWIVEPGNNSPVLTLEITGGLSKSPYWTQRRPGILAPVLEWL